MNDPEPGTEPETTDSEARKSVRDVSSTEPPEAPVADDADSFPRDYVEKLRRESAGYRAERDQLGEMLAVAHRERIDAIRSLGLKAGAVWATVGDPVELLGEDGQPDSKKIRAAVEKAKQTLGIKPDRARTGLRSGSSTGPQLPRTDKFVDAFKPARGR